jgi:hypothetical protein
VDDDEAAVAVRSRAAALETRLVVLGAHAAHPVSDLACLPAIHAHQVILARIFAEALAVAVSRYSG